MIVMKFGGTSVQDAAAINQVVEVVSGRLDKQPVVVVSAMAGITDSLIRVAETASERKYDEAASMIDGLRKRHLTTAFELLSEARSATSGTHLLDRSESDIQRQFAELDGLARSVATLGELTPRSRDAIASFGERLSALLVTASLLARGTDAQLVDSRTFIITDDSFTNAVPDMVETEAKTRATLRPILEARRIPVAQGFIGSTASGVTTTIGRGGSDYSAALIGASMGAAAIEIWTDVDGLMTADPRIVADARRIRLISFAEAAELSYFGAKVLHPSTVLPAIERGIPVNIYNTRNPSCEGTLIMTAPRSSGSLVKSIAVKRGVVILNVNSTRMLLAHGFLRTIFEVFERHQTSVDVVTTSEVSVSMSLDSADRLEAIERDLSGIGDVTVEGEKAIICVVGENLRVTPGVAARLFKAIESTNVNMISQGASEINLTFVIDDDAVEGVVRRLHEEFFKDADPDIFD